jgi:hypothetical protein
VQLKEFIAKKLDAKVIRTGRSEGFKEQHTHVPPKSIRSVVDRSWWLFCMAVLAFKFLLLGLDPLPKLYLGDSLSYLETAISGWMPGQRSFVYGYVIRWTSLWTGSLTWLLVLQVFLSIVIALIAAWICRAIFDLPKTLSYLFGFLCSIDPLQLAWERYVMTETCSLFFYALVVQQSFVYLRSRRMVTLLAIQALSVIMISFRMSFLIVAQVNAVALPVIAFFAEPRPTKPAVGQRWRLQLLKRGAFWRHLAASAATMFLLDQGYQHVNGFLSHREPARLYDTGYFLLAIWAPALQPQDAADPRLAEIIRRGSEFGLRDIALRDGQLFSPGFLVDRWRHAESDPHKSGEIAVRTALNAFYRDPATVIGLAAKTYFAFWFWSDHPIRKIAKFDLGNGTGLTDSERKDLAKWFHWAALPESRRQVQTMTTRYYEAASPYFFLVLLSPVVSLALLFIARNKAYALLLFAHTTVLLASTFLLSLHPDTRFLHPLSFLMLLNLALAVKSLLHWRSMARNGETALTRHTAS